VRSGCLLDLLTAVGHEQQARRPQVAGEETDHVDSATVGPVHVLQYDHQNGAGWADQFQQPQRPLEHLGAIARGLPQLEQGIYLCDCRLGRCAQQADVPTDLAQHLSHWCVRD
jgi:hypothetical protein